MVANKVTKAAIQLILRTGPPPLDAALVIAVDANEIPMTIAIEPVTEGGKTFSMLDRPKRDTITPAKIETKPDMMIPN